jgi:DNA primase catalytic core
MPRYSDDELDELKRRVDLVALIRSRGIELRAASQGNLVGLCPFHEETTPSFGVSPAKKLWHCLGCGAGGNAIQFLMKKDGLSFRHAVELLKSQSGAAFAVAPATVPKLPAPVAFDADDRTLLRQVTEYYHKRLLESPPALAYLQKRGVTKEAVDLFQLGFADRTLGLTLPEGNRKAGADIRARLMKVGIIRAESGHEHLNGCVVFPLRDGHDAPVGLYGRKILDNLRPGTAYHLYLPGPHRGLFNRAALASREIILCESILDALAFWCAGFRNVLCLYGTEGFTDELWQALLAAKVETVWLAYDRDKAGDKAAARDAAKFAAHGIGCRRVLFPPGMDANEYARKVTPPQKSLGVLLNAAPWLGDGKAEPSSTAEPSPKKPDAPASAGAGAMLLPRAPSSLAAELAAKEGGEGVAPPALPVPPEPEPATAGAGEEAAKVENDTSSPLPVSAKPGVDVAVVKDAPDEVVLLVGDREWRVRGLDKNAGFAALRVSLRVRCGERWHLDTLDLAAARSRDNFVSVAAGETALRPELLKRDIGKVLLAIEGLHEARLRAAVETKASAPTVGEAERAEAFAWLRGPGLIERLRAALKTGLIGEENNALVLYFTGVSRLLRGPLAVIIQAPSAGGKSTLMDAVLAFFPSEEKVKYSAMTGQSLYYLGETSLKHKILAVVEEAGAEKAAYALKLLQSEHELTIASTGKDPATGRMVTQEYHVEGPVALIITTTAIDLDEELQNRCLVLTVDDSPEQTAKIHTQQRERRTLAGLAARAERTAVLRLLHNAQRLLRPLAVLHPFASGRSFPRGRTRARRDHEKYLTLIDAIALLHQHQREIKKLPDGTEYIEATAADAALADELAREALGRSLDELPPQTRKLLDLLDAMVTERCAKMKCPRDVCLFSRRDVREKTGWGNSQLKVHLDRLTEFEYLVVHRGSRGQGFVYELAYDEKFAGPNGNLAGANGQFAGGLRPQNGGMSAPLRPPEKPVSPSGNGEKPAPNGKIAHLDAPAKKSRHNRS